MLTDFSCALSLVSLPSEDPFPPEISSKWDASSVKGTAKEIAKREGSYLKANNTSIIRVGVFKVEDLIYFTVYQNIFKDSNF